MANAGAPDVVLCTHIDTVPPVLDVSEDDTALYGRGGVRHQGHHRGDARSGGSAFGRTGSIASPTCLLWGEETGGDGAKAANRLEWNSNYVIVGEPTELRLARAQKGTLMASLRIEGKAAHSGYPEAGRSAVHPLLGVLQDCIQADWGRDPVLGPATCNVGVLRAGEKANIIAPEATATLMLRTIEEPEKAYERLAAVVAGRADIEILAGAAPQFMHVPDGFPDTVVSFGSDVPYLGNLGKALLAGPGSILDAHTAHERILKQDLLDGIDLYERLVHRLLA